LADVSDALDDAASLVWQLAMAEALGAEALELTARVEAARAHVQSLRVRGGEREPAEFDPEWAGLVPWDWRTERSA
jgi:hypothetical protein